MEFTLVSFIDCFNLNFFHKQESDEKNISAFFEIGTTEHAIYRFSRGEHKRTSDIVVLPQITDKGKAVVDNISTKKIEAVYKNIFSTQEFKDIDKYEAFIRLLKHALSYDWTIQKKVYSQKKQKQYKRQIQIWTWTSDTDEITHDNYNPLYAEDYNVFIQTKEESETSSKYPFELLHGDVCEINMVNFAMTSYLKGELVDDVYKSTTNISNWFTKKLEDDNFKAVIVINSPFSLGAMDAQLYKMKPSMLNNSNIPISEIISENIQYLFDICNKYKNAKLYVYLTRVAIPYGIAYKKCNNTEHDFFKIDMYAAFLNSDADRPSFYLTKNDRTKRIFDILKNNISNFVVNSYNLYSPSKGFHPDIDFISQCGVIAHVGKRSDDVVDHTRNSIEKCVLNNIAMAVDLFKHSDGTIKVESPDSNYNLEEFLDLIQARVPVIFKIEHDVSNNIDYTYVDNIVHTLRNYSKKYFLNYANKEIHGHHFLIHSSRYEIIKEVKAIDALIPTGLIYEPEGYKEGYLTDLKKEIDNKYFIDFVSIDLKTISEKLQKTELDFSKFIILGYYSGDFRTLKNENENVRRLTNNMPNEKVANIIIENI